MVVTTSKSIIMMKAVGEFNLIVVIFGMIFIEVCQHKKDALLNFDSLNS